MPDNLARTLLPEGRDSMLGDELFVSRVALPLIDRYLLISRKAIQVNDIVIAAVQLLIPAKAFEDVIGWS